MAPNAKGKHDKGKYKDDNENNRHFKKSYYEKTCNNVKENIDNNNVVLKSVNETLTKLEKKIDEYSVMMKKLK